MNRCATRPGEWIFWMDADDRLDDDNRAKLKKQFAELPAGKCRLFDEMPVFAGPRHGHGDRRRSCAIVLQYPRIRWKYRIHEQILMAVRLAGRETRWSDVMIHTGYQDSARRGPNS